MRQIRNNDFVFYRSSLKAAMITGMLKWLFVQATIFLAVASKGIKGDLLHDEEHQYQDVHEHGSHSNPTSKGRSLSILDRFSSNNNTNDQPVKRCGHLDTTTGQMNKDAEIVKAWVAYKNRVGRDGVEDFFEVVQTYFHIITDGLRGNYSDAQIYDQLFVLNSDFQSTGFQFTLAEITRTDSKNWYTVGPNSLTDLQMKAALRQGDASALNVFIVGQRFVLGWSSRISMYNDYPKADGVVIYGQTMPGGNHRPYNLGRTLTHEVGHWIGLFHTFENNQCLGNGDFVNDTPFEKNATIGCPRRKNSCKLRRGRDPVHNFMDYAYDRCVNEFTRGQIDRMEALWTAYRKGGNSSVICSSYMTSDDCLSGFCFWDVDNSNCLSYSYYR